MSNRKFSRTNINPKYRSNNFQIDSIRTSNYFGNRSDGDVVITTNTNFVVPNKNGSYDGDYVVKQYSSLTINEGVTVTTDQPCKGMFIYVDGDCTINGTLSMRSRGASCNPDSVTSGLIYPVIAASGSYSSSLTSANFNGCGSEIVSAVSQQSNLSGNVVAVRIPSRTKNTGGEKIYITTFSSGGHQTGNAGGNGSATISSSILNVRLGGGGGGGAYYDSNSCGNSKSGASGRGGDATCFSGGTGGGGKMSGRREAETQGYDGSDNGGAGGDGGNGHCGGVHSVTGGVGNPGGWDQYGSPTQSGYNNNTFRADSGTGGVIWLVVRGNLTIGASGVIDIRGTDNTNYNGSRSNGSVYGAGGASGGGAAILLHKGIYTAAGNILTSGGTCWASGLGPGGAGGAGVATTLQIA
jgi:hypothetical protein